MTSPQRQYTEEEYLALEEVAEERHEYINGQILIMAGAEPKHELLCASVIAALATALRGRPCFAFASNMRVKVDVSGLYTYPDVSALCGRPEFAPTRPQTLLNPNLIVEVLSPSTELYDRVAKFEHYKRIPSLAEYVLVAQESRHVERYVRHGGSWIYTPFSRPDDVVELPSIGAALHVGSVYEQVDALDWPPSPPRLLREAEAPGWGVPGWGVPA